MPAELLISKAPRPEIFYCLSALKAEPLFIRLHARLDKCSEEPKPQRFPILDFDPIISSCILSRRRHRLQPFSQVVPGQHLENDLRNLLLRGAPRARSLKPE